MAHHLPNHLLIIVGVLRETNLILYIGKIYCYPTSHLPLGVTNEGREVIITSTPSNKFLAPLPGTLSDKIGELPTTFYLYFLVLLVYLSSFCFCFCVLMKNQKNQLLSYAFVFVCLLMLSLPWVCNHPNMVGWTCFTWIVFDQFVLALKNQPTWLRENHWMGTLIIWDTAYLIKGNTNGIKYKFLIAMLSV